ncbi:hypothetical protein K502DRAFT_328110 [Neoconidiobolus thromboides FSU 785]|nr:hypothetical protein K502DRAFT_328110 [Neoconidiobolus thromboides FSU 785]
MDNFYYWVKEGKEEELNEITKLKNTKLSLPKLSLELYESYFKDPDWTFEECKYLMELCKKFDCRFLVIHDRYEFQEKQRGVEEIKEKFYIIYNKLTQLKENNKTNKIIPFDKNKELQRKKQLSKLFLRSKEEIMEEEQLLLKLRKLKVNYKQQLRQRDYVQHLLNNSNKTSSSLLNHNNNNGLDLNNPYLDFDLSTKPRKKRNKKEMTPSIESYSRKQSIFNKEDLEINIDDKSPLLLPNNFDTLSPSHLQLKKEKIPVGAYLRSSRIAPIRPAQANLFAEELNELGLSTRPFMPTERCCTRFEEVQDLVLAYIDSKKQMEKLDSNHSTRRSSTTIFEGLEEDGNVNEVKNNRKR